MALIELKIMWDNENSNEMWLLDPVFFPAASLDCKRILGGTNFMREH